MFPVTIDTKYDNPDGCPNSSDNCLLLQEETNKDEDEEKDSQWIKNLIGWHKEAISHKLFRLTVLEMSKHGQDIDSDVDP